MADAALDLDADELKNGVGGEKGAKIAKRGFDGGEFWAAGATDGDLDVIHEAAFWVVRKAGIVTRMGERRLGKTRGRMEAGAGRGRRLVGGWLIVNTVESA